MQAKISDRVINKINISNKNTTYDLSLPDSIRINEYVNLPPDMSAYSDQRFQQGIPVWQLPSDLDNEARYKVTMANELYEGKEALKITAVMLLDDRAKQKQIAIGNTPREPVKVIWFDMESLTILKEIYYGYYFSGPSSTTTVVTVIPGATPLKTPLVSPSARPAASDPPESMQQIETRNETVYQDYSFDFEIPDSEFEIDPQDYPGARITRTEVDLQEKLK
jgi:hypothetical protein